jgi:dolichol-phosphate mannosyltransferase
LVTPRPPEAHQAVSVILPSYNERENIAEAIARIEDALGPRLLEIIVVDDDSPDGTWELVQGLNDPQVVLIHRTRERGLASAIAEGTRRARGGVVAWMDCDLGLPPEDLPRLVDQLDRYDVAMGSRFVGDGKDLRPKLSATLSYAINVFAWIVLGSHIRDYTSGFIAVRKSVLDAIPISPKGFGEYFIEFIHRCHRRGFKIIEVPYVYRDRSRGVSKSFGSGWTIARLGWQYGVRVLQIRFDSAREPGPEGKTR